MSGTRVAKRYARALLEAAEAAGELATVVEDVKFIASVMSLDEICDFCVRPSLSREVAREFVGTAFEPRLKSAVSKRFLEAVLENDRLALLPLFGEAFEVEVDTRNGVVKVDAVFASSPDSALLDRLKAKMGERAKGDIRLEFRVDERLIKGFRLIWNNRLLDRSVAGGIRGMRLALKGQVGGK